MANEKRLIDADVLKHRLESHIATAIHWGVKDIPMGRESSSAFEYLRGYERGAVDTANIALGQTPVDAVEVVHGRWINNGGSRKMDLYCSVCNRRASNFVGGYDEWWDLWKPKYCPNCGAKMDGDGNEGG